MTGVIDRAPGAGWEHFTGGIQAGYHIQRDDTVAVTLAARSEDVPREAFVQHAYPLEAADVAWLIGRLAEAHRAMTGRRADTFDQLTAGVANVSTAAIEDSIFANGCNAMGEVAVTSATARNILDRLLELGWTPPAVTS